MGPYERRQERQRVLSSMSLTEQRPASDRLILSIKSAYWMALLIIAGMALASYLLIQHMLAAHQRDESLMELVDAQKTLSQRIVFLAGAIDLSHPQERRPLVKSLRVATERFEANYDD